MNYELAKELKNRGFPQIAGSGRFLIDKRKPHIHNGEIMGDESVDSWASRNAYAPTLSELIEACGDKFNGLNRLPDGWHAYSTVERGKQHTGWLEDGMPLIRPDYIRSKGNSSPEEAVARLWLTLKGKKE